MLLRAISLILLLSVSWNYFQKFYCIFTLLLVPINSTSLAFNDLQPHYEVGSNVTLTCFVTNSNTQHVDIDITVNIQWGSQNSPLKQYNTHSYNKGFTHTLTQLKLSDAGEYKCSYYLTSANDSPYIKPSEVNTGVTTVRVKSEFTITKTDSFSLIVI